MWCASGKAYPISDQNMRFSLSYFRPDPKFDTLYFVCVNLSVEQGLKLCTSQEVEIKKQEASSKNHAQFLSLFFAVRIILLLHILVQFPLLIQIFATDPAPQASRGFTVQLSKFVPYFRPKWLKNHTLRHTAHLLI